jgi:hypothetical protein
MNRNRLIPLIGVVIALIVLWFLFFASRPSPQDQQDGVVGAEVEPSGASEDSATAVPADVVQDE